MSYKIVGLGEVLWDLLPSGPQLGGAPANFAFHARALGAQASVVTRVGDDELGRAVIQCFQERGLAENTVQVDKRAATGTVTVTLAAGGVPDYVIGEGVAWDRLAMTAAAQAAVNSADAICFGSLGQRSRTARTTIKKLVGGVTRKTLRVFDINLRQKYYTRDIVEDSLGMADVLKLNESELPILAYLFKLTGSTRHQIESLAERFNLAVIALTRGPAGSLLYQAKSFSDRPGQPVKVVDTVGAGDAFAAALVLGLLRRMELEEIHAVAGDVASYVCSCAGATPPLPKEFRDMF